MNSSIAFVVTAFLSLGLQAKDKEYVEYTWWAAHKPGSWVKLKMETEAAGQKIVVEATHTLLEVSPEKAVVERKTKVTAAGVEQPGETEKEELAKDKDKDPIKIEKEGDEEIEVNGKKMPCHWIQGTQKDAKVKFWLSKEIPGGIAKGEASGGEIPGVLKISAAGWEKK